MSPAAVVQQEGIEAVAEQQQGDFIAGLVTGAIVGGIVGGVIGVTVATRLRRSTAEPEDTPSPHSAQTPADRSVLADLSEEEENEAIAQARRTLEEKIAQLNEAIQDTRAQLLVQDPVESD